MDKRLRGLLTAVLLLVAVICAGVLLRQQLRWRASAEAKSAE